MSPSIISLSSLFSLLITMILALLLWTSFFINVFYVSSCFILKLAILRNVSPDCSSYFCCLVPDCSVFWLTVTNRAVLNSSTFYKPMPSVCYLLDWILLFKSWAGELDYLDADSLEVYLLTDILFAFACFVCTSGDWQEVSGSYCKIGTDLEYFIEFASLWVAVVIWAWMWICLVFSLMVWMIWPWTLSKQLLIMALEYYRPIEACMEDDVDILLPICTKSSKHTLTNCCCLYISY